MKILITGSSGFLGSHLCKKIKNQFEIYQGNLLTDPELDRKLKGVSVIIHLAGEAGRLGATADDFFQKNVAATFRLLKLAKENKVKKIVFPSTGAVYGFGPNLFREVSPPLPQTDYGFSKMLAEEIVKYFSQQGIAATVLRFNNIFGPGNYKGVVYEMIQSALKKGEILYVEGKSRDFLFVDDAIRAIIKVVNRKKKNFEVFNISGEENLTLKRLAILLGDLLKEKKIEVKIRKIGQKTERLNLNNSKAKKILGWRPQIEIKEGLEQTINYFLKNK